MAGPKKILAGRQASAALVVIDSSCWLEVLDGSAQGTLYEAQVAAPAALIVPIVTVYKVYKYLVRTKGPEAALRAALYMQQGRVVSLDWPLCMAAAHNGLPLADSFIYACAQAHGATLWTQDAHFEGLPGVRYFPKRATTAAI